MNLKCKINGKEYNVAQGATFAEEYNETLDSGTIIIPHVKKIRDLMPFDDVFIYDSESEFKGYGPNVEMPNFYKHLLVDQFTEEIINLDEGIYTYKIELMSETKKLEVIQLPNISITQPLNFEKKQKQSIYQYLLDFVELYSPLKKVAEDGENKKWKFEKKYSVDPGLEKHFGNVYAPDFSLNAPSLKDVIAQLMLVKDRIPFVKDDVICALDISARKGKFDLNTKYVNYISGSRSSANHADNLKRTYSNALSQDNTCNMVEYTSFRNSDSALLTLDNMRLETRYPIYKINKVYMCYYKKVKVKNTSTNEEETKYFLCKQDISKLVKVNSERNLLSQDWDDFHTVGAMQYKTIDELAKFKMMTVGYNIGSNFIEGWGTKYTYPSNWFFEGGTDGLKLFDNTASYIQNIFNVMNDFYPFGIYDNGFINEYAGTEEGEFKYIAADENAITSVLANQVINVYKVEGEEYEDDLSNLLDATMTRISKKASTFFKSLFFVIDYNAFYNGTVVYSKDDRFRDDITINDNASASLTLLEKDGLFQKEKANRFGNKGIAISARYNDISQIQKLGSVYENDDDTDVVIYHKEYSIFDNMILCSYAGTKNYVLKNYFTSVFARYRTYNLMSYGESTTRAENNKMMILFSKDKSYYEKENKKFEFDFTDKNPMKQIFSFFTPTLKTKVLNFFENRGDINAGYIEHIKDEVSSTYLSDVNKFVAGNSLCFNIKMFDNVSGGVYVKTLQPKYHSAKYNNDFVGSVQDWYMMVDDVETGKAKKLGFYVCNLDYKDIYADKISDESEESIAKNIIENKILKLPKISSDDIVGKNVIGGKYTLNKDNKEIIDMTFQIEPICYDKDVVFSPWMMKLSDLLTRYNKFEDGMKYFDSKNEIGRMELIYTDINNAYESTPMIIVSFDKKEFEYYKKMKDLIYEKKVEYKHYGGSLSKEDEGKIVDYSLDIKRINQISEQSIEVEGKEEVWQAKILEGDTFPQILPYKSGEKYLKFNRIYNSDLLNVPEDKVYFSNIILKEIKVSGSADYYWEYEMVKDEIPESQSYLAEVEDKWYSFSCGKVYDAQIAAVTPSLHPNTAHFENSILPRDLNGNLIYKRNMYLVYGTENIKKDVIYEEYELDKLPEDKKISEDKVSDRFTIKKDDLDRNYLKVDLLNIPESTSSVQYWFLNNGSLHFVFGVNITQEDRIRGYVKIYLSLLSTRDTRVYDENNNLIGEIYNYADLNNDKKYGKEQYYCAIIENDSGGK